MANLSIHEVLNNAGEQVTKQDKIDYLKKNNSVPLQTILKGAYDDTVQWNLPEGRPPYRTLQEALSIKVCIESLKK